MTTKHSRAPVDADLGYAALKQLADSLPAFRGWDFSPMRTTRDPTPWDYHDVAHRYLTPTAHVLDVGTGGGEQFLRLAPSFGRGVGVDPNRDRLRAARENASVAEVGGLPSGRVTFRAVPKDHLPFPDASFDVVLLRHAPVLIDEIVRVLRPGGHFVTQGVGRRNMHNICAAFRVTAYGEPLPGPKPGPPAPHDRTPLGRSFESGAHRVTVVARGEYDVYYYVRDAASFLYWLKALDLPPGGFDIECHWRHVARIIRRYSTAQGVRTNEHRTILVLRRE